MKGISCRNVLRIVTTSLFAIAMAACNDDVSSSSSVAAGSTYFNVGGTVAGLSGSGLVLQNNNGDSLPVAAAGAFTFKTQLTRGNSFSVSVLTQPLAPSQTCVVTNGTGTVGTADVTTVTVTCTNKTTTTNAIGGSVSGLAGSGLVLQNDGGDNLPVAANGNFVFPSGLPTGMPYAVTVLTPPMNPFQNCSVVDGAGTTAGSDINNVTVSCKTNSNTPYTIGGTISGVSSTGAITLQDDGTDNLTVAADGAFTFVTPIPTGSAYSVTALGSNASQSRTCAFTNASGIVGTANVANVAIVCTATTPLVNISVSVTGFNATTLVLQDNGGDSLAITTNGTATFATPLASGGAFAVTVLTQPTGQTCTITNGAGTVATGTPPVAVACAVNTYSVGGSVAGLNPGNQVTLVDNGGNAVSAVNGAFNFSTPIVYDGSYAVTVSTQPVGQICTVMGGSGTGVVANVSTVSVVCSTDTYTIGGTVTGLLAGSQVTLENNGGNALTIGNGRFTFTLPVAFNGGYAVTVSGQPTGQICSVAGGTGAGVVANVTNVAVMCSIRTFTISGTVVNLGIGTQVTLDDNGGDPRTVTASGAFTFATAVAYNGSYSVTVGTEPTGQTCTVINGAGAGVIANVANVTVTCSPLTYTIGGTLHQLGAATQVTLNNNGTNPLTLLADGTFTFSTPVVYNGAFNVTIGTQPLGQICSVANGTGAGVTANVTTVSVTCSPLTYTIGGTLQNLGTGTQVTLDNNGANPLVLLADGTFSFTVPVPYNGSYAVTIGTQPTGQICTVTRGSGAGVVANVTNVLVSCAVQTFTVSGNVNNLVGGTQVTLDNNAADPTTVTTAVTGNVPFMFQTPIAYGSGYSVTVGTEPTGQTCTVMNGMGVDVTADVTNVAVNCATATFPVSGTVTGLAPGGQVTLRNNGANPQTVTGNANGAGTFTFTTQIAYNGSYLVTVGTNPVGQLCTVNNGTGTNVQAPVTNVSVSCANSYTIGGTIAKLLIGTQLTLYDNNGDALLIQGVARPGFNDSSTFTFATPLVAGSDYSVTLTTQPTGQTCTISSGSGTDVMANVTSVSVSCVPSTFYTVSGTVTGLATANDIVELLLNGGDGQNVIGTGAQGCCSFAFDTTIPYDGSYTVSIGSQPADEVCSVSSNASATNVMANVTNVGVTCAVDDYTVSGTVTGLANGLQVVLDNNGGDPQTVTGGGNGQFQFTPIASGSTYAVSVASQPAGQICTVMNGSGTISGGNVSNVSVSCVNSYTIGGTISGLGAFGLNIRLTDSYDSGDPFLEPASGSTSYSFPNSLPTGTTYTATITNVPSGYGCEFGTEANGTTSVSGTVGTADVTLTNLVCYTVP